MAIRLNLYLPKEVTEALKQLAEKNYRTVTAEALIALTKHLKAESDKEKAATNERLGTLNRVD